jgi:ribosomal protein S8
MNTLNKKKYFYYSYNKKNLPPIYKFMELNLICGLKFLSEKKLKAFIPYKNGQPLYKRIKLLYKPSHKFIINFKTLDKINKYKNSTFLMFTNIGFVTNHEALNKRVGGIIFCRLN